MSDLGEVGAKLFELGAELSKSTGGRTVLVVATVYGWAGAVGSLFEARFEEAGLLGLCSLVPLAFALVGHRRTRRAKGSKRRGRILGLGAVISLGLVCLIVLPMLLFRRRAKRDAGPLPALDLAEVDALSRKQVAP